MNLLSEREKTHGEFAHVSDVSQYLKEIIRDSEKVTGIIPWLHKEALEMICVKMARIICGDHNEPDHWTDIKGYAELVLKHIKAVPPGSATNGTPDEPKDPSIGDDWDYNPRSGLSR